MQPNSPIGTCWWQLVMFVVLIHYDNFRVFFLQWHEVVKYNILSHGVTVVLTTVSRPDITVFSTSVILTSDFREGISSKMWEIAFYCKKLVCVRIVKHWYTHSCIMTCAWKWTIHTDYISQLGDDCRAVGGGEVQGLVVSLLWVFKWLMRLICRTDRCIDWSCF